MSTAVARRSSLPGFGLTMGLTLTWLSVIILIPLAGLFLKTLELSPAQCHVLHLIEPGQPLPMNRLAETLSCDASNVTGLTIARIERRLGDCGTARAAMRPDEISVNLIYNLVGARSAGACQQND